MELQNATVFVTGATGNVGPYVVDQLVNDGATVITNTGVTGQIVQMTGGQPEVAA
ncbi:hypothetical protein [Halomontanus rarus]|uniref:hypothetical protein n=1 Tax=Halomontanus rarus TaxID=3034020 RepID=UPI001A982D8B